MPAELRREDLPPDQPSLEAFFFNHTRNPQPSLSTTPLQAAFTSATKRAQSDVSSSLNTDAQKNDISSWFSSCNHNTNLAPHRPSTASSPDTGGEPEVHQRHANTLKAANHVTSSKANDTHPACASGTFCSVISVTAHRRCDR